MPSIGATKHLEEALRPRFGDRLAPQRADTKKAPPKRGFSILR
ncbi:hypothetical protein J2797_002021 [Paraburkholderia terricola]|uniref:Uncharacterized protein n=1 Tax=Paraburkholderia terricola TaxID=169427 RepID=A0ABU1LTD6_9BURK|nr:hypothetical protein [Paraburkholderia terricola]MDR6480679.1 hypothetical protein [Paraburkholderia terricola]MDR6492134.1 hypothetical protein [Paraburkholderia terricola]